MSSVVLLVVVLGLKLHLIGHTVLVGLAHHLFVYAGVMLVLLVSVFIQDGPSFCLGTPLGESMGFVTMA